MSFLTDRTVWANLPSKGRISSIFQSAFWQFFEAEKKLDIRLIMHIIKETETVFIASVSDGATLRFSVSNVLPR